MSDEHFHLRKTKYSVFDIFNFFTLLIKRMGDSLFVQIKKMKRLRKTSHVVRNLA